MEIVGAAFAILVFIFGPKAPDKSRCEREKDGESCYQTAYSAFVSLHSESDPVKREELKQRASKYVQLGCQYGHKRSCEDYERYQRYLKKTPTN